MDKGHHDVLTDCRHVADYIPDHLNPNAGSIAKTAAHKSQLVSNKINA